MTHIEVDIALENASDLDNTATAQLGRAIQETHKTGQNICFSQSLFEYLRSHTKFCHIVAVREVAQLIEEKSDRDRSPEAKAARRRVLRKAVYGEFMCSLLFYTPIFCLHGNAIQNNWPTQFVQFCNALVTGLQAIGVSFAFSLVSGAQFNPALSFALWTTGKLSNRRAVLYVISQLVASLCAMVVVACIFSGIQVLYYSLLDLHYTPV